MERGQVTIPKKIRDRYGLKPDTEIDMVPVKEGILIVKKSPRKSPLRDVYGILGVNRNSDAIIEDIRGR